MTIRFRIAAVASMAGLATIVAVAALFWSSSSASSSVIGTDDATNVTQAPPSGLSDRERELLQPALRDAGLGPEPQAFTRPARRTDTPLEETDLLGADARLIATSAIGGKTGHLYVGKKAGVLTCLVLQVPGGVGGAGCSPAANPFGRSHVMWGALSENTSPQRLTLTGVVDASVGRVEVGTADGKYTVVPLSVDDGFIYTIEKEDIANIDVPQSIRVFNRGGRLLTDVALGITFGP